MDIQVLYTALLIASEDGNLNSLKNIIQCINNYKHNPIISGIKKIFLQGKRDKYYYFGQSLIICVSNNCLECTRELLNLENNPKKFINTKDLKDKTPLFIACENGSLDICSELLKAGASQQIIDVNKNTPLLKATMNRHFDIVKELLKNDKSTINNQGIFHDAPIFYASESGNVPMVQEFINAGADLNLENNPHYKPLMHASRNGHTEVVRMLIEAGADVNQINRINDNALIFAVKGNHIETIDVLLDANIRVNAKDNVGFTALMVSLYDEENWRNGIIKKLLVAGADPTIKNIFGTNPINTSKRFKFHKATRLFYKSSITVLLRKIYNTNRFLNKDLVRHIWRFL